MKAKGKHFTAVVADRIFCWAVAKWGNMHVDALFCERMEEILHKRWPKLKDWGKSPRTWSEIIANHFANVREAKVCTDVLLADA